MASFEVLPGTNIQKEEAAELESIIETAETSASAHSLKCQICPSIFLATQDDFEEHMECHVDDEEYFKCPHCTKITKSWTRMGKHLGSHTGKEFKRVTYKKSDVKVLQFMCNTCQRLFTSKTVLKRHETQVHGVVNPYTCHICDCCFKYEKAYKRHMDIHSNILYQCEHCDYNSRIRSNIRTHMNIHEGKGHACEICGKLFTMPCRLRKHQEMHTRPAELRFPCTECDKLFSTKASLQMHTKRAHTTTSCIKCQHCDYVGKDKSYLQEHMRKKHFKAYTCNQCSYATFKKSTMTRHMETHREYRPYQCPHCFYRAREHKTLLSHARNKHSKDDSSMRKHECPMCLMKFKSSSMLKSHIPTHTGDKPHKCKHCDYSAKHRATLYRHTLRKHRSEIRLTRHQTNDMIEASKMKQQMPAAEVLYDGLQIPPHIQVYEVTEGDPVPGCSQIVQLVEVVEDGAINSNSWQSAISDGMTIEAGNDTICSESWNTSISDAVHMQVV